MHSKQPSTQSPPQTLRRDLQLVDAVAVGLGAIIGGGIFVVTGVAAAVAGPALVLSLLLASGVAMCNALSSAQLAARYPQSGGTYEYGYRVLSPWLGFSAGWMFLVSKLAAGGTVALGFASYAETLFPTIPVQATAVLTVVVLTLANLFGIKKAGRINIAIVCVSILSLLYFVIAGSLHFETSNMLPFAPRGMTSVLEASALLFFAYTGYARIATLGEEVAEPQRTIPKAIILSLSSAAVLYLLVALVALGSSGAEALADNPSPLLTAASSFTAPFVSQILLLGATAAMLGVLLSQILGISRMIFAMSRRNDLPPLFAAVSTAHGVPHIAILSCGSIIAVLALFGTLESIIAAATFSILLYYSIANIAALCMPAEDKLYSNAIPAIGLCTCLALACSLPLGIIVKGLSILLIGLLFRMLLLSMRTKV